MTQPRYAILHHRLSNGEHWDLLLETGDVLAAWQLPNQPTSRQTLPLTAVRIADHRKRYLDYEGPISRNRGTVARFDGGEYDLQEQTDDCWIVDLRGHVLRGRFRLVRPASASRNTWSFEALLNLPRRLKPFAGATRLSRRRPAPRADGGHLEGNQDHPWTNHTMRY